MINQQGRHYETEKILEEFRQFLWAYWTLADSLAPQESNAAALNLVLDRSKWWDLLCQIRHMRWQSFARAPTDGPEYAWKHIHKDLKKVIYTNLKVYQCRQKQQYKQSKENKN